VTLESVAFHSDEREFAVVQVAGLDESAEGRLGELAPICEKTEDAVCLQERQRSF